MSKAQRAMKKVKEELEAEAKATQSLSPNDFSATDTVSRNYYKLIVSLKDVGN